jgi:sugar phosphate isomerase/epimerase
VRVWPCAERAPAGRNRGRLRGVRIGGGAHLTYCTNVHPGERWSEVRDNLALHVGAVRAEVCPDRPFGTGVWLSSRAVAELQDAQARAELVELLDRHGLYVFTLNGFPYGAFHGRAIKERVYQPDWRQDARREYSDALATLLAQLLPDGVDGSISTLPGAFRPAIRSRDDEQAMADQLLAHAAHLHALHERTGKRVALALEAEPCCYIETTAEAIAFFERWLRSERAVARVADLAGVATAGAAAIVERHLGVCLDACHAAVEFEDPAEIASALRSAAIPIAKIQLSSGLRIGRMDAAARAALQPYLDEVYLHQVVERRGTQLTRHLDLSDALAAPAGAAAEAEWRIHFHVPVFLERMRAFDSTQSFLRELLALQRTQPLSAHLEVETYTWDVLPDEARSDDLTLAIARELRFCLGELGVTEIER